MHICARMCVRVGVCVHVCVCAQVCFDCVLVLCFVMGYVLQSEETAHKRVHYDYYCGTYVIMRCKLLLAVNFKNF